MDGIVDVHITTGSVDDEAFCGFIEHSLQPQLLPYNGSNPRSVVILDNASIHHVHVVCHIHSGALPMFLPPYSDFMPIEECFSKVKSYLRGCDSLALILAESEMGELILVDKGSEIRCRAFHFTVAILKLTTWSPARVKVKRVVTIADSPDENSRVPAAPSKPAITLAAPSTVGLAQRV